MSERARDVPVTAAETATGMARENRRGERTDRLLAIIEIADRKRHLAVRSHRQVRPGWHPRATRL